MYVLCMSQLAILIEGSCKHPANTRKTICRSTLDFNDNVHFPFENIMQSFRTIYPTKTLVFNFTII